MAFSDQIYRQTNPPRIRHECSANANPICQNRHAQYALSGALSVREKGSCICPSGAGLVFCLCCSGV